MRQIVALASCIKIITISFITFRLMEQVMNNLPSGLMSAAQANTLTDLLTCQATLSPDQIAFYFLGESYTFAQFDSFVKQLTDWLISYGIAQGDRIVFVGKDAIDGYALLFAASQIGAVLVPVNWRLTATEVAYIIDDCQASLLIVQDEFTSLSSNTTHTCTFSYGNLLDTTFLAEHVGHEQTTSHTPFNSSLDTGAVMLYTSGTTGKPKGVLLAHRTFFSLPQNMLDVGDTWMNIQPSDTLLLTLPMFHIGGLWWAIQGLRNTAAGVIEPMFVPWRALELIENHEVSLAALVPAMLAACLNEPDCEDTDLTSIRGVLYGGSPISAALLAQAMQHFNAEYFQIYGLTETGNMAVCLRPEDHLPNANRNDIPGLDRVGIVGKPLPSVNVEVRKSDEQDNFTLCEPHEIGEIFIQSPSVMLQYWNKPQATSETLNDGWIRTGDAGYFDADGYLMVCDRIKDMIIRAGENLYPAEIESALASHPAIKEVAVIGVPHEQWGEEVLAVVVLHEAITQLTVSEIQSTLSDTLALHKHPTRLETIASLPRNPSGKVLKHKLREPYWQHYSRQVN